MSIQNYRVISREPCQLGEGCIVSDCKKFVCWVDINTNSFFLHSLKDSKTTKTNLKSKASSVIYLSNEYADFLDDSGVSKLIFSSQEQIRINSFDEIYESESLRANDGALINGAIYFGTMKYVPEKLSGSLYMYKNEILRNSDKIGIPNTFIAIDDGIIISDSMEKKIFLYDYELENKKLWCDLSSSHMTPDGGCIGKNNNIFISMWGAGCIGEFNLAGDLLKTHKTPVENPTNCASLENNLLVTSAKIETKTNHDSSYKLNGHTFILRVL